MEYLVLCKSLDGRLVAWKEFHFDFLDPEAECFDSDAVEAAFEFSSWVDDDVDIVEIFGNYPSGLEKVCDICF